MTDLEIFDKEQEPPIVQEQDQLQFSLADDRRKSASMALAPRTLKHKVETSEADAENQKTRSSVQVLQNKDEPGIPSDNLKAEKEIQEKNSLLSEKDFQIDMLKIKLKKSQKAHQELLDERTGLLLKLNREGNESGTTRR